MASKINANVFSTKTKSKSKTNTRLVSVVINGEFIKMAEITNNGKNMIFHKVVSIATPDRCYSDGTITDPEIMGRAMQSVLNDNRIKTDQIAFSIISSRIATKEALIPVVKDNKIADVVQANAGDYFPVNIEEYIIRHTVLEKVSTEEGERIKLMVAAAPSDVVESYYALAKLLGMKVAAIDYSGNSITQALATQIGEETTLAIEIENDATTVAIFRNNVLQLQRSIPYGKSLLVKAVMDQFKVSYDEALLKLQTQSILHARFDGDPVTESVRYMVANISRIIDFYVSRNGVQIQTAGVYGNAATIGGLVALMSKELGVKLMAVETVKGATGDKKTYINEAELNSYLPNIGALVDPADFVPRRLIEEESKKVQGKNFIWILAGSVFVSAVLVLVPLVQIIFTNSDIKRVNGNIARLKTIEPVVNAYYEAKDKYNDLSKFADLTKNNDDSLGEFIKLLEERQPTGVTISSFAVNAGAVSMSGSAESKSEVARFVQQLQSIPTVSSVMIGSLSENKNGGEAITVSYSITCTFGDIKSSTDNNGTQNQTNQSSATTTAPAAR